MAVDQVVVGIGPLHWRTLHLTGGPLLAAMRRVRDAFNPERLCNPGKIFPTTRFCVESNPHARGYDQVPL